MIDKEGMKPWEICGLCHNLNGISHMAKFPKLAGQKKEYIEKQLYDFKNGKRTNDGGQMEAIVNEISNKEIPEIATYFSSLPSPKPGTSSLTEEQVKKARNLFESGDSSRQLPACKNCHQKSDKNFSGAPEIRTQHPEYISKQLHDFKTRERQNDQQGVMQKIAEKLTDEDINNLAGFLSNLAR